MNHAQLRALLTAGAITPEQYADAVATLAADGTITARPQLNLTVPVAELDLPGEDEDESTARLITGIAAVYEYLIPSHQMVLHTGSLMPRQPLDKNKLLRDHNHADPVGFMTAHDASSLSTEWDVPAGENGDRALTEAANKLRDGLSVGFTCIVYDFDDDWVLHVWEADWYETSLCAIPAITDAGVTNVAAALAAARKGDTTMNKAQLDAALAAGTIGAAQHAARLAALEGLNPATASELAELAAGPEAGAALTPRIETRDRGLSMPQAVARVREAAATGDSSKIVLAMQSMLPADDAGKAFYGRGDWIGEAWEARPEGRPWIESLGATKPLTGALIEGFQWAQRIAPEKYSGNRDAVATGKAKTKKVTAEPERWAFATGIDRILTDLGSDDAIASLFGLLAAGYQQNSDADVAVKMLAAASIPMTVPGGDVPLVDTSVLRGISGAARDFRKIGAHVDQIWLAEDLFDEWAELKIADLPAWLANQLGFVDLREGTSIIGDLSIGVDAALDDGDLVAYDKRAVDVHEANAIQLSAISIADGGIDLGWFNYGGLFFHDKRAIQKRTVVTTP